MNGQGIFLSKSGIKYVGEYKNDKRNGIFLVTYKNGSKYEGLFKNDKKHGQGTATLPNGKMENSYLPINQLHLQILN